MGRRTITIAFCLTFVTIPVLCVHSKHVRAGETSQVTLLRTPHEGIQPQTVLDRDGVLHMIYFNGDASGGDIEYVSRKPNGKDFWEPIRVNSQPGRAIAIGTVRGPQLAVGRNGRVYVIWFGSQAGSGDPSNSMAVFFSRLNDSHAAFEPQRNLMQYATGGDGGISIAADARGDVYAVWHVLQMKARRLRARCRSRQLHLGHADAAVCAPLRMITGRSLFCTEQQRKVCIET